METKDKIIIVIYGAAISREVDKKALQTQIDDSVLILLMEADYEKVECINPKLVSKKEYNRVLKTVKDVEEYLKKQNES